MMQKSNGNQYIVVREQQLYKNTICLVDIINVY